MTQSPADHGAVDMAAVKAALDAGAACEAAGDPSGARAAYARAEALDPEDRAGAGVRLAALDPARALAAAPPAYVATLFDQQADSFEELMIEELGYVGPLLMRDLLRDRAPDHAPASAALDLGCGGGLAADALSDLAARWTGVDLSERMLAVAAEKEVYAELYRGEALAFLAEPPRGAAYDLIVALDLAPYLGDLGPLVAAAAERLGPGGRLALSAEVLDPAEDPGPGWRVTPARRFAHTAAHLEHAVAAAGLVMRDRRAQVARTERGDPVRAHFLLAAKG